MLLLKDLMQILTYILLERWTTLIYQNNLKAVFLRHLEIKKQNFWSYLFLLIGSTQQKKIKT